MNEGNIILCPDSSVAIIAEIRGKNAIVIKKNIETELPYLDYYPISTLKAVSGNIVHESNQDYNPECLVRFYDYYTSAQKHRHPYLSKAAKEGLVPKRVTIRGKNRTYTSIRYVKIKAPKVTSAKRLTSEEKAIKTPQQKLTQQWKEQLTPTVDEYKGLVEGDREVLGQFVMKALWKKGVGEVETANQVSLTDVVNDVAARITGVRPEGFQASDIMQEVAIKLMEMQDQGRFANEQVPREKFASFLANVVRNTSLEILRKQNIDKYAEQDINDFADKIADAKVVPLDEQMDTLKNNEKVVGAIKEGFANLPIKQKIALDNVINGKPHMQIVKELKITPDSLKSLVKRAYNSIAKNLQKHGIPVMVNGGKGFTKEIKSILKRENGAHQSLSMAFKAKIFLRDEKLLIKAKKYEVGQVSKKTGKKKVAPGKWEDVGEKKPGKDAGKPTDTDVVSKKEEVKASSQQKKEATKKMLKDAIRGFIETMSDVFMGRGGGETAAQEIQKEGEAIKVAEGAKKQTKIKKKSLKELKKKRKK